MSTQASYYEDSVFDLLTEENPDNLEARRILALKMVRRITPLRLRALLSPTLACALLDAMRLGGLEFDADTYAPDEYEALIAIRRVIAEVAHFGGRRTGVASVYARGGSWEPVFVSLAPCPGPMVSPGTIVIDDARHRVDGPAAQLRAALAERGGGPSELLVVRSRFAPGSSDLPGGAVLATVASVAIARRQRVRSFPRFAAVAATDPQADLQALPADVRIAFLGRGAKTPIGAESWAEIDGEPGERTLQWLRDGGHACVYVDSPAEVAELLARLHADAVTMPTPIAQPSAVPLAALWGAMAAAAAESRHG
jgi:hypothetical protein